MLTSVGSTTPSTTDGCGGSSSIASRTSGSCGSSRNGWTRELSRTARGRPARREPRRGATISPLIANIFLHHGFDAWMTREYPGVQFERFADDVVVHCVTERQALSL